MATTKLCKLYYANANTQLTIKYTATASAVLPFLIKDTAGIIVVEASNILHNTETDLISILEASFAAEDNTEYELWVDDTVPVLTLECNSLLNENQSSYVTFEQTNPILINLTSFTAKHNVLLTTGLIFPDFANALNLVDVSGNQLTSATQDAIILAVWNNAIRNLSISKTFNILGNDGTYSAQSAAYLTALNDNATFKWTINTVAPAGSGFTSIDSVEDLQTLAVNKTVAAVQTKDIDASVTHTWGINKPTYQLIIPTTITGTALSTVVNGNMTFGSTTVQVCGVYFDHTQTLKGFYVNSTTALTGDIAKGTFTATAYDCYPINHYYADLTTTYATEKARFGIINDAALYNLTDTAAQRVVGYNDELKRVYYMGQTIGDNTQAKTGFVPIGIVDASGQANAFVGSYDCQGFKITNMYINSNARGVGVFGKMYGNAATGYIADSIQLKDSVIISFGNTSATDGRVGMVGSIETNRILRDSYNTGSMSGIGNVDTFISGLVGYNYTTSKIYNCYSDNNTSATGKIGVYSGGLVGFSTITSQIYNCYSIGNVLSVVHSSGRIGGIVGWNRTNSQVYNCFGYGTVSAINGGSPLVIKGIYTQETSSSSFNVYQLGEAGVGGLTAAQFQNKASFATVTANYTGLAGVITYSTTVTYLVGTRTLLSGVYYICIQQALNKAPATETTYWTAIPAVAWDDETNYTTGTFHIFGGKLYYCYTDMNTGIEPGVTTDWEDYWNDLTYHDEAVLAYANTGRVITTDGKCYVCIQAAPIGTLITDTAYWLEDTGFDFNTIWRMGNLYPELMAFYIATYNFFKQNFGSSNFIFKQRG